MYLASMPQSQIERNATFKKRKAWHYPFDEHHADAFFTSMSHLAPRIIINDSQVTCTNALYRLNFMDRNPLAHVAIALAAASTFSQLSSEYGGRAYGAGLLKHEPSDAKSIRLLLPSASTDALQRAFDAVNGALQVGSQERAADIADAFL